MTVIRRWECRDCGRDQESLARPGFCVDERCDGEMVEVRYAPAEQLQGAVARLERAETLLRELCHREGNPRAVRRTMDGVREFVDLPRLGGR